MKALLTAICLIVLAVMLFVTVTASIHEDVVTAARLLLPDPWFRATLADAYFGFLFFWLWVAWRERSAGRAGLWFILIMTLGNFAMAGYLLWHLRRWEPADGIGKLLMGERHGNGR
ncbi:DUF1475 family protein [Geobacter sulfurreducens]|uniref:DUF1475 family protein n=1 Tax=Geobacter sulfurreducens TaxID=35554 RepID=UPI0001D8F605|nr:DUF1475 family protein [Geobacter sulfurreducens]ADI85080.1 hypothetical protein KN400_2268 [Geobacter sulfurreducens KN400]